MNISIIITYFKNLLILYQCLDKLKNSLINSKVSSQIIIINDNPHEKLSNNNVILNIFPDVRIVDSEINRGYAGACNCAITKAENELVVLLDSDIMVTDGWLEELYDTMKKDKSIGAVSSVILNMENNTILHCGFGTYKVDMIKPFVFREFDKIPPKLLESDIVSPCLTSGCCLLKKSVYFEVGGMDEQLYNGYCDLDLFYKIRAADYKNLVSCKSLVFHRGTVSGEIRNVKKQDTKALFCSKWSGKYEMIGLEFLEQMYSHNIIKNTNHNYIIFDFSQSLFSDEYINIVLKKFYRINHCYKFNIVNPSKIILEDYISLSLQRSEFDFIYFCDNYKQIKDSNYYWFSCRSEKDDLIIDRNGNVISLK